MTPEQIDKLIDLGWMLVYVLGGVGGTMGAREATYWVTRFKQRRKPEIEKLAYTPSKGSSEVTQRMIIIQDHMLTLIEKIEKRLAKIEQKL